MILQNIMCCNLLPNGRCSTAELYRNQKMAESTGFEPVVQISSDNPLAGDQNKPLLQLSKNLWWWSRLDLNQQAIADDLQSSGVTNFPTTPYTPM